MIQKIAIFNCSPLLYLAKIGFLPYCEQLFAEAFTSPQVHHELLKKEKTPEQPALELAFNSWLKIKTPDDELAVGELEKMGIHAGEAEVIAIAQHLMTPTPSQKQKKVIDQKYTVVIDDRDAREICHGLQIPVTGTVGILLYATRKNIITPNECEKYFDKLLETTFYLSGKMLSSIYKELHIMKNKKENIE